MSSTGTTRRHIRPFLTCCVLLIFTAACYEYILPFDQFSTHQENTPQPLDFLRRAKKELSLDLTAEIIYSRRCVKVSTSNKVERDKVVKLDEELVLNPVTIRMDDTFSDVGRDVSLPECVPLRLSTPKPYPQENFPELVFGMATSYERLNTSTTLESIEHWSAGKDSKLFVMVEDYSAKPLEVLELQAVYRDRGIVAEFIPPLLNSTTNAQNHFLVLTQMVKNSGPEAKWFGLLDDDTFFPHLKPLATALGRLDHTADMYVGALAEDFGSVRNFGIMAYGGAGAYLSVHLAKKLGTPVQAKACLDEAPDIWGDIVLRNCVYRHSQAKLTILPGLYQHDLMDDLSGFYESGVEPVLNLHHWKSWYHAPVVNMAQAATFCGRCFLQRWTFGSDTVLSNGYSIVIYAPDVLKNLDLERKEHTWRNVYWDMDPEYDFSLGPLRDAVKEGDKKSYKLVDAEVSENGQSMRQLYVFSAADRGAGELDEVVELIWTL